MGAHERSGRRERAAAYGVRGSWTGLDLGIAAALFLVTFFSRLPFRTSLLYAWDSVLYARAIEHFDVTIHQPQPPGHIFYVGLVWLADRLTNDANTAMVWISILSSAAAVVALFWLGRELFGRNAGLLAAILLLTSLSFWAHGEVAYPYTLLALLSTAVAALVFKTWEGRSAFVLPAALLFGIAGGFRQDLLFFLLPIWLVGLTKERWRRRAGALAILVVSTAAWYIPAALLSGGFSAYREASSAQSDFLFRTASVFYNGSPALTDNLKHLGLFTLFALSAGFVVAGYFLVKLVLGRATVMAGDRRFIFLLLWIAPSALFYVFIHVGEYGYVFTFLPALLLFSALGIFELAADIRLLARKIGLSQGQTGSVVLPAFLAGALVVVNLGLFLVMTPHLSANRLAANEDIQQSRIDTIRDNFDHGSTLIISTYNYQQARYYLPGYIHRYIDPVTAGREVIEITPGVNRVVLFDESLEPADGASTPFLPLAHEQRLDYFETPGGGVVTVDWPARTVTISDIV